MQLQTSGTLGFSRARIQQLPHCRCFWIGQRLQATTLSHIAACLLRSSIAIRRFGCCKSFNSFRSHHVCLHSHFWGHALSMLAHSCTSGDFPFIPFSVTVLPTGLPELSSLKCHSVRIWRKDDVAFDKPLCQYIMPNSSILRQAEVIAEALYLRLMQRPKPSWMACSFVKHIFQGSSSRPSKKDVPGRL